MFRVFYVLQKKCRLNTSRVLYFRRNVTLTLLVFYILQKLPTHIIIYIIQKMSP